VNKALATQEVQNLFLKKQKYKIRWSKTLLVLKELDTKHPLRQFKKAELILFQTCMVKLFFKN